MYYGSNVKQNHEDIFKMYYSKYKRCLAIKESYFALEGHF